MKFNKIKLLSLVAGSIFCLTPFVSYAEISTNAYVSFADAIHDATVSIVATNKYGHWDDVIGQEIQRVFDKPGLPSALGLNDSGAYGWLEFKEAGVTKCTINVWNHGNDESEFTLSANCNKNNYHAVGSVVDNNNVFIWVSKYIAKKASNDNAVNITQFPKYQGTP